MTYVVCLATGMFVVGNASYVDSVQYRIGGIKIGFTALTLSLHTMKSSVYFYQPSSKCFLNLCSLVVDILLTCFNNQ